ncbi:MAG TPA: pitrilysin family protein [Planctomycetota bacterium]|nr:pitrilysin family protein [Planctomycetota bacterium]
MNNLYQKTTLPNGLRLIRVHMPSVHSVAAGLYVKSGPRFESAEKSGISHFVEHMLFKGTRHIPNSRAISDAVENIGGDINGSTMPEYSEFSLVVHPRHLDEGLRMFSDILLDSVFDPNELENEKQIIIEEISQYLDVAGDSVSLDELSYNLMWPTKSTSYSALGSDETIKRFTRDDIVEHYRRFFVPSNMVLTIAGNFDPAHVDSLVAELFGGISGEVQIPEPEYIPNVSFPRMIYKKMPTRMGYMKLCHKACSYRDPNLLAVLVVCDILGGGTASKLFARLREELGLVYDISTSAALYSDVGSIDVMTSTNSPKLVPTLQGILDVTGELAVKGITEHELARVKDRVACQMEFLLDSPGDLVEWFGARELLAEPGKLDTPAGEVEHLRAVTTDDVNRVMKQCFVPGKRGLVLVGAASWPQRRKIAKLMENT